MKKLLLITFLLLIGLPLLTIAQQTQPTINSHLVGRVIDSATREPLPGAVVKIQGTTHVVSTDIEGKFSFVTGQKFPYKLIITFTGYEKRNLLPMVARWRSS
ncbi:carboxypeptidase-like regulatory domain-containing protein [Mucilaginibacter sp. P25]|uniref:carboxypeptidase-like regulatory domain-containing protein n=1 Tax=unclassified Mucilaginibacter TaxID=2617802 RepID=UPI003D6729F9